MKKNSIYLVLIVFILEIHRHIKLINYKRIHHIIFVYVQKMMQVLVHGRRFIHLQQQRHHQML
jgi:hypothetical protein